MPRFFHITLLALILMTTGVASALARMVVGVTPAAMPGAADRAALTALEQELSSRIGEPVQIRAFDSEAAQLDWLIRFRELDAALVSRSLVTSLPAGTLIVLADLPAALAVTHPGADTSRQETLGRAFRNLAIEESGRRLLSRLSGTAGKPANGDPVRAGLPAAGQPVPLPSAVPVTAKPANAPALAAPAPPAPTQPAPQPVTAAPPPTALKLPPAAPSAAVRPAPAPAPATVGTPPTAATIPDAAPRPGRTRLLLLAALSVAVGIGIKLTLLLRHWQRQQRTPAAPPEPPAAEDFVGRSGDIPAAPLLASAAVIAATDDLNVNRELNAPAMSPLAPQPEPPSALASAANGMSEDPVTRRPSAKRKAAAGRVTRESFPPLADDLVVEQGKLGRIKVPGLLKRCAELPQPVLLRIRAAGNETCLHFAAGQICHVSARSLSGAEKTRQWHKLGYLMVRDGLISEAQRDQALEQIERQPGLRFAAALRQIGAYDLEALRHILTRQAKTAVFGLILFSSGEYRIEADAGEIPAEESIALQVEPLIREASHHQAEWTAIRKTLPNLTVLLDFAPDGREKLEQVRLSVHQQLLLAEIDGQTPLGALCSDSTMMDYEACRFLYLMVKAGVLQVAPAA